MLLDVVEYCLVGNNGGASSLALVTTIASFVASAFPKDAEMEKFSLLIENSISTQIKMRAVHLSHNA